MNRKCEKYKWIEKQKPKQENERERERGNEMQNEMTRNVTHLKIWLNKEEIIYNANWVECLDLMRYDSTIKWIRSLHGKIRKIVQRNTKKSSDAFWHASAIFFCLIIILFISIKCIICNATWRPQLPVRHSAWNSKRAFGSRCSACDMTKNEMVIDWRCVRALCSFHWYLPQPIKQTPTKFAIFCAMNLFGHSRYWWIGAYDVMIFDAFTSRALSNYISFCIVFGI